VLLPIERARKEPGNQTATQVGKVISGHRHPPLLLHPKRSNIRTEN
jgi:hypothetical protein